MTPRETFIAALRDGGIPFTENGEVIEVLGEYVYLPDLTMLPENVTFNNGAGVYLPDLTAMPEVVTFNNGGEVWLPNLTMLPENFTFNNGGGVYLDSLTVLSESVLFNNDGDVDLPSLTDEVQTYRGKRTLEALAKHDPSIKPVDEDLLIAREICARVAERPAVKRAFKEGQYDWFSSLQFTLSMLKRDPEALEAFRKERGL